MWLTGFDNVLIANTVTDNFGRGIYDMAGGNTLDSNFSKWNGDPLVNIALGKPTLQSSNNFGRTGAEAVDGNTDGEFWNESVTCTHPDNPTWWQIDLGRTAEISAVRIYNRTDCCSERLADFYVEVSNDGITWDTAVHYPGQVGTSTQFLLDNILGRYVRIRLNNPNYLSLAEVQVFEDQQQLLP